MNNIPECWVHTSGGPLMLFPSILFKEWSGILAPTDGRVVEAVSRWRRGEENLPATDYDRACDIEDYVDIIPVKDGYALVLGDEPLSTLVQGSDTSDEAVLVRPYVADDFESIRDSLDRVPETEWIRSELMFKIIASPLCLMESAIPGNDVHKYNECEDYLYVDLKKGVYSVETAFYKPDESLDLLLHRLRLTKQ